LNLEKCWIFFVYDVCLPGIHGEGKNTLLRLLLPFAE
jgi:hypothetical protein